MQILLETAKRDRIARNNLGEKVGVIPAGETCLALVDHHGWKTNLKEKEAMDFLKSALTDLKKQRKKPLTEKQKTSLAAALIFAGSAYFGVKLFKKLRKKNYEGTPETAEKTIKEKIDDHAAQSAVSILGKNT